MTTNHKRMVRLMVRFQNAVDAAHAAAGEQFEMDREFDGGEFSGPALDRELRREEDRLARRFGFTKASVAFSVAEALGITSPYRYHQMMGEALPLPLSWREGEAEILYF